MLAFLLHFTGSTKDKQKDETIKNLRTQITNKRTIIQRLRVKLSKARRKIKKRVTSTKVNKSMKEDLIAKVCKILPGISARFFASQIRMAGRNGHGYRWSNDDKTLCLKLYHSSPKCYRLLLKCFALPSIKTLRLLLQKINMQPGFNPSILDALKIKAQNMDAKEKVSTLLYDEMSMKEALNYDVKNDCIDGLEDYVDGQKTQYIANHAGVFMVTSMTAKWKQPFGYFLTSGPMDGKKMRTLLLDAIQRIKLTGLKVLLFICDQGSNNRSMLRQMGVTADQPYFLDRDGEKVFVLYDPPHLVKNTRNNFKSHGFILPGNKKIMWKYVQDLYQYDKDRKIRMVPKLSEKHINLPPFKAMSVKLATQVLSNSVAAGIYTLIDLGKWPDAEIDDAMATADFIYNMNGLFDVFNSRSLKDSAKLKQGITSTSTHFQYLEECMTWLPQLKLLDQPKKQQLPCILGWQHNIKSLKMLWDELRTNHDVSFLLTNRISQDKLENSFSQIRYRGGHRDNPDSQQFNTAYMQIAVDNVLTPTTSSKNCEDDPDKFLLNVENLLSHRNETQNDTGLEVDVDPETERQPPETEEDMDTDEAESHQDQSQAAGNLAPSFQSLGLPCALPSNIPDEVLECLSLFSKPALDDQDQNVATYMTGYLLKKTSENNKCPDCSKLWTVHDEWEKDDIVYTFTKHKQYSDTYIGLQFPTLEIVHSVIKNEELFRNSVLKIIQSCNVMASLEQKLSKEFELPTCGKGSCMKAGEYMVKLYTKVRLHHFIKEQNRHLRKPNLKRNRKMMKLSHV